MTTPNLVQFKIHEYGSTTSPMAVTLPGTNAGNIIVVIGGNQTSSGVSFNVPTDGVNTYVAATGASASGTDNSIATQVAAFYALNIAGGTVNISMGLTGSGSLQGIFAFELSGVNAYDVGAASHGSAVNATCGPITLNHANEITVVVCPLSIGPASAGPLMTYIETTPLLGWGMEWGIFPAGITTPQINNAGDTFHAWAMTAPFFYGPPPPAIIISPTDAIFYGMT